MTTVLGLGTFLFGTLVVYGGVTGRLAPMLAALVAPSWLSGSGTSASTPSQPMTAAQTATAAAAGYGPAATKPPVWGG